MYMYMYVIVSLFLQLAQPVDLSQWPPLFIINSTLPVVDPTSPPSITTLTTALTIGCDALKKVTRRSQCTVHVHCRYTHVCPL